MARDLEEPRCAPASARGARSRPTHLKGFELIMATIKVSSIADPNRVFNRDPNQRE